MLQKEAATTRQRSWELISKSLHADRWYQGMCLRPFAYIEICNQQQLAPCALAFFRNVHTARRGIDACILIILGCSAPPQPMQAATSSFTSMQLRPLERRAAPMYKIAHLEFPAERLLRDCGTPAEQSKPTIVRLLLLERCQEGSICTLASKLQVLSLPCVARLPL